MANKIHEFDPVIYPYKLWILVDKDTKAISEQFNEYRTGKPIEKLEEDTKNMAAFAMPVESKNDSEYGSCDLLWF